MHSFSIGEALTFGWDKTRAHSGLLFKAMLTLFAVQVASAIVQKVLENTLLGVGASLALGIASIVLGAGFMHILLKLAHGQAAHYADLIPPARMVWHFFCASLLAGLAIVVGLIALIIPGIYLAMRFSMVRFAVLDGAGIMQSLRQSSKETHGHKWHLLGFFVVLIALNLIGLLALYIGLLITVPVSGIAWAHVYIKLKSHA